MNCHLLNILPESNDVYSFYPLYVFLYPFYVKLHWLCTQSAFSPILPLFPWFSWPISICLHQSYQLTRGLDSSAPATPSPPSIPPSLHPSMPTNLCYTGLFLHRYMRLNPQQPRLVFLAFSLYCRHVHKERTLFFSIAFYLSGLLLPLPLMSSSEVL